MQRRFVLAMTGASGAGYGLRLVEVLAAAGGTVHVCLSDAGRLVLRQETSCELGDDLALPADLAARLGSLPGRVCLHRIDDLMAPIASGSFATDGMVICPCSGGTLAAVVQGLSLNLIHRAAEVHLKERRTLILVPRETPLSLVQLDNWRRAAELGAIVLPAAPGFYHRPTTVAELVDFIVARICDQLKVAHQLVRPWGSADDVRANE